MTLSPRLFVPLVLLLAAIAMSTAVAAPKITVIYDAFGDDPALQKDWGFAALVEVEGKRILFDTGNDAAVFERNVRAKGIDLSRLDFVVLSHRHSDHIAGLSVVLAANPEVTVFVPQENFGVFGSSLPSGFIRKDDSLPARMRYYDGDTPERLAGGTLWPRANFKSIAQNTEIAPGVHLIAAVSEAPGTRELRELSLALGTPQGLVLVVGCSHPGIGHIVAEAARIDPSIHLVIGGFHYVNADDAAIAALVDALKSHDIAYLAPAHCTGEPTFAALQAAFGERYLYAGVGAVLDFSKPANASLRPGVEGGLPAGELAAYRLFAAHGEHAHGHGRDHAIAGH